MDVGHGRGHDDSTHVCLDVLQSQWDFHHLLGPLEVLLTPPLSLRETSVQRRKGLWEVQNCMLRMMQVLPAFPLYMGLLFPLHVGLSQSLALDGPCSLFNYQVPLQSK